MSNHQAGGASPLLVVGMSKAGMPAPSWGIHTASYPQSIFNRCFQGWKRPCLSRGMRQGTTSSESLSQSISFCLCPSFALKRKGPSEGSCAWTGCPVRNHNSPPPTSHCCQQLYGSAGFSACCIFLTLPSAGPNLSPLYLYANSKTISIC